MRIAVLLMVFVAGCASTHPKWTKEGSKPQDFDVANSQCEAEALSRANVIATHISHFYYMGCMQAQGWTPPPVPKEEEEPKHESPKEEHAAKH